jgi:hypothetical protein
MNRTSIPQSSADSQKSPVPFTHSAEAYPLYIRPLGMSLVTAATRLFNSVLSLTWPSLVQSWTIQGAFSWYAAWNIIGWVLVPLFVPETKAKILEELDSVFDVPIRSPVSYGIKQLFYFCGHYILRRRRVYQHQFSKEKQHDPTARV